MNNACATVTMRAITQIFVIPFAGFQRFQFSGFINDTSQLAILSTTGDAVG